MDTVDEAFFKAEPTLVKGVLGNTKWAVVDNLFSEDTVRMLRKEAVSLKRGIFPGIAGKRIDSASGTMKVSRRIMLRPCNLKEKISTLSLHAFMNMWFRLQDHCLDC